MMRVTGGSLRSRRVHAPRGRAVRPTPGRVREALFSILGDQILDARILDLFAGTGALGFEALSRGAAAVTFVEANRQTAASIERAARSFDLAQRTRIIVLPAERAVRTLTGRYDVVFADPPYAMGVPDTVLHGLAAAGLVDERTTIVFEHSGRAAAPELTGFAVTRTERYGDVALSFLRVDGDG
ncbi:MAG TPA: 16S rRNA (guanine(966)-N(2))-methyltransferase RsmD [Candidatus Binatia bacterium]|nr:16S rRNA (guanine(966)-N(2))-methyltransferase RsmD [Candidatus Binatia bacterium]